MFFVYVIRSRTAPVLYKGHCEDIELRLKQHNSGMTKSIRPFLPFDLIYSEGYEYRTDAVRREKYLKSAAGRRFLKSKLGDLVP